jgi:hypothetical protein
MIVLVLLLALILAGVGFAVHLLWWLERGRPKPTGRNH